MKIFRTIGLALALALGMALPAVAQPQDVIVSVPLTDVGMNVAASHPDIHPNSLIGAGDALALYDNVAACEAAINPLWIHDHPQKVCYVDQSEWPFIDGQGHWSPADNPIFSKPPSFVVPSSLGHTHGGCWWPYRAEIDGPIRVRCKGVIFHSAGKVVSVGGPWTRDVVLENGATFPIKGNPDGVVEYFFSLTVDLNLAERGNGGDGSIYFQPHGWMWPRVTADTVYDNGDSLRNLLYLPLWSMYDPSGPLAPEPGELGNGGISSQAWGGSARDEKSDTMGVSVVSVPGPVPILGPLTSPWPLVSHTYNYTDFSVDFPLGEYSLNKNPNLHAGFEGVVLARASGLAGPGTANRDILTPEMFNPTTPDKLALFWTTTTGAGGRLTLTGQKFSANEQITSVLVLNILGSDGTVVPPPPPVEVCGDGIDNDKDGFIDEGCTVTPPPVDPGKLVIPTFRLFDNGVLKLCVPDGRCVQDFVVKD
jgi:hypothetical protein